MNENINLVEILKDCPKGMKLYSSVLGEVIFKGINVLSKKYPIQVKNNYIEADYTTRGHYVADNEGNSLGECTLFPSRNQRDWSKFELPKKECEFEPFQKVLVRDESFNKWKADFYSHYQDSTLYPYICLGGGYSYCIPYEGNEHLLGTKNNPEMTEGGEE